MAAHTGVVGAEQRDLIVDAVAVAVGLSEGTQDLNELFLVGGLFLADLVQPLDVDPGLILHAVDQRGLDAGDAVDAAGVRVGDVTDDILLLLLGQLGLQTGPEGLGSAFPILIVLVEVQEVAVLAVTAHGVLVQGDGEQNVGQLLTSSDGGGDLSIDVGTAGVLNELQLDATGLFDPVGQSVVVVAQNTGVGSQTNGQLNAAVVGQLCLGCTSLVAAGTQAQNNDQH